MARVVLDASAVLALLANEPGADIVGSVLSDAVLSAVNQAEIVGKLADWGLDGAAIEKVFAPLGLRIVPFDASLALMTAAIRRRAAGIALSLGDRACLALGRHLGIPVYSADRAWGGLGLDIDVRLIR